jgi:hypothetical protein
MVSSTFFLAKIINPYYEDPRAHFESQANEGGHLC